MTSENVSNKRSAAHVATKPGMHFITRRSLQP